MTVGSLETRPLTAGTGGRVTSPLTRVIFRVAIDTASTESVRVVGNCADLGNWSVELGHPLVSVPVQNGRHSRLWISQKGGVGLPLRIPILYKYVIVDAKSGDFSRWEAFDGNRSITPNGPTMVVEDDEGLGRLKLESSLSSSADSSESSEAESQHRTSSVSSSEARRKEAGTLAIGLGRRKCHTVLQNLQDIKSEHALTANDTVIIVSYELPYRAVKKGNFWTLETNKAVLIPTLHSMMGKFHSNIKFVGVSGVCPDRESDKREIKKLFEAHHCLPVFADANYMDLYTRFCHQCLWPLFHNVLSVEYIPEQSYQESQWQAYQTVNRIFADVVVLNSHETDLVWVHDYYLLLVPQYITRRIRKANVGLFLHVPFPSSEIFRCLPVREELLRGMLCADLIGFHFFEYARHFLVILRRLLGLVHHYKLGGYLEIDYSGRKVSIFIGHVDVESASIESYLSENEKEVKERARQLRTTHQGKFIFAGVDRSDKLAGLKLKLRAYRLFLQSYPYARASTVLLQYLYPTPTAWHDLNDYTAGLKSVADEINAEFATSTEPEDQAVVLKIGSIDRTEKYSVFQAASCLVDTSVRDGLNLIPFEFVCCRKSEPATLVVSEFTGCSQALTSAIRINPWKTEGVASALDRAVSEFGSEQFTDRFFLDRAHLQQSSTVRWATDFLTELHRAKKSEDVVFYTCGIGTSYRVLGLDSNFQCLDVEALVLLFKNSRRRVLFFDHEGTLAPDRRRITAALPQVEALSAQGAAPSQLVRECLTALSACRNTVVVILSGREKALLDEWFKDIPNLGLCAEHGYYFKMPYLSSNEWHCLSPKSESFEWKGVVLELLKQYVKRTQGSFIENKGSALVFQYRDADPDFGAWQAKELSGYLEDLLFSCPVTVMSGKGYVEVKLRHVDKGRAVSRVLSELSELSSGGIDFVLCVGDDRSDEDMFPVVNRFFSTQTNNGQSSATTSGHVRLTATTQIFERAGGWTGGSRLRTTTESFLPSQLRQDFYQGDEPTTKSQVSRDVAPPAKLGSRQSSGVEEGSRGIEEEEADALGPLEAAAARLLHQNVGARTSSPLRSLSDEIFSLTATGFRPNQQRPTAEVPRSSFESSATPPPPLSESGGSPTLSSVTPIHSGSVGTPRGLMSSSYQQRIQSARYRRAGYKVPAAFSVTVGKKPSNAKFYLNDVEEVSELLLALKQHCVCKSNDFLSLRSRK